MRDSVVFPDPDSPMTATVSPLRTSIWQFRQAKTVSFPSRNVLDIPRPLSTGTIPPRRQAIACPGLPPSCKGGTTRAHAAILCTHLA